MAERTIAKNTTLFFIMSNANGLYFIFLKAVKCGDLVYGRHTYDYQEGTLVFIAPGQVAGKDDTGEVFQMKGWGLCFHPDLIRGTPLAQKMNDYTFFSYEANESLHMSERERQVIKECADARQFDRNVHRKKLL